MGYHFGMVYLKIFILIIILFIFFLFAAFFNCFYVFWPRFFRYLVISLVSSFSKLILSVLNVELKKYGEFNDDKPYLIVSNHMTYLDIMIMSSVFPSLFITSIEMKNTFFLGQIVTLGKCLFTERRGYMNLLNEIYEVKEVLKTGTNVVLFPEAKSTDGEQVIPFKRAFFYSAKQAEVSILPVVLNYTSVDGETLSRNNRNEVFWYDGMEFVSHFIRLCRKRKIMVELYVEASFISEETSKELRDKAFKVIQKRYNLVKKL